MDQLNPVLRNWSIRGGVRTGSGWTLRTGPAWHAEEALAECQVPSTSTINRILRRHGLVRSRPRKRPRDSSIRFERPGPVHLWGIDIMGGIELVNPVTGEVREAKIVTGVDDHSRSSCWRRVERTTGRAVCLAFAEALALIVRSPSTLTISVRASPRSRRVPLASRRLLHMRPAQRSAASGHTKQPPPSLPHGVAPRSR